MIERKRANIILDEAKNVDIAFVTSSIFKEIQDNICHLQAIDGILNMHLNEQSPENFSLVIFYRGFKK